MKFCQGIPVLLIMLSGCSNIQPGFSSSSPGWEQPKPATREQRQRISAGESASAVLNERGPSIGGTIDWSTLWDR
ncbi:MULTISPECIES: hypothetical protein [Serratia]|jgi:hypothetical protein|uniref:hypothetical protein n=1 Tax=Serratia TaxID=613 RepID=UPI0009003F96|nr:hypothetical protein [Serratia liquefaciens]AUW39927.1 hypothetical protein AL485_24670 [Serratia liquefaciens]MDU4173055.1 hypothetical protein [Serratia liquefaciens]NWA20361.1 hypothetical protein [Serratia liquefaciens]RYM65980.1 hypothetical protein BSQ98_09555 [Serratia liquefaciens]RYM73148.1 hypothetical protein BSQ99_04010 [Serratia liquefaciens]